VTTETAGATETEYQDPRKYVRLADKLRRDIEDGTLPARQPVPPLSWLAREHRMAVTTARRALRQLQEDELIQHIPGHGYYVS
jgi:DNA-binding GntR family transcriptional regulator